MNAIWFREVGFHNNPFSIKPAAFHDHVVGFEKVVDEISYGILNKKLVVVEGDYGNGKSSILRRLLNDFGGKKQVIYYSCNRMEARLDVKELLNGRYGFFGRMFDMKPRDMILLLDEAQELNSKDFERLLSYYQEGYIKSIVLIGKGIKKDQIVLGFKTHLSEVSFGEINEDIALQVIKKRIGDLPLLPDSVIRKIYQHSQGSVRVLLKNCEEVCKKAVETGRKRVTEDFLKQFFSGTLDVKKEDSKAEEKKEVKAEVKKEEKIIEKPHVEEKKAPGSKVVIIDKRKEKKEIFAEKEEKPKAPKKEKGEPRVYRPDEYKGMVQNSAEELLDKPTDEIFGDEQYY
ncbi:hypothetical protein HZA98_00735 [Candidatus Woesearchaeota archaeon]|nr:hypothetical protein [Candidatus Woesearchaeota archaeon]